MQGSIYSWKVLLYENSLQKEDLHAQAQTNPGSKYLARRAEQPPPISFTMLKQQQPPPISFTMLKQLSALQARVGSTMQNR
jgi:hypothetical protein